MNPSPGGPYWTPITPITGSFFHADSQFLKLIGLEVSVVPVLKKDFLKSCRIVEGCLQVTASCPVSNLLHEAGHLAIVPNAFRYWISDDVEDGIEKIYEISGVKDLHPDHPLSRALIQCSDVEATAWAWAAGKAAGIKEEDIILDHQYEGAGRHIRASLRMHCNFGINGLVHAGMCLFPRWGGYPIMQKWLQDAERHAPNTDRVT